MIKFIKKVKNNKGLAESLMFVVGSLFVIMVIGFCTNTFNLTWQRYTVHRQLYNETRLFATRWTETYIKTDCNGTLEQCKYTNIEDSPLVNEMKGIVNTMVTEGNLDSAELVIGPNKDQDCNSAYVCISQQADNVTVSGANWDTLKRLDYGTTLWGKVNVRYTWRKFLGFRTTQDGYTLTDKFASERFKNSEQLIGS